MLKSPFVYFRFLIFGFIFAPAFSQIASQFLIEGNKAYEAKDYVQAAANYQNAIKADQSSAGAYQGLGNCDIQLGKKDEALAQYEKALALNPDSRPLSQVIGYLKERAPSVTGTGNFSSTPTASPNLNSQLEKQELDIETLRLQVDQLRKDDTETNGKAQRFQSAKKSEELAKAGENKENLLVLDWINGEIWNKGARFSMTKLYDLAQARGWPVQKTLKKRSPDGRARWHYQIRNMSLTRYQDRSRGIFEIQIPSKPDDFEIVTTEGINFQSSAGDTRADLENIYFDFEGQEDIGTERILKFKRSQDLDFDDKLEISFSASGRITSLRYGVLDEH